ncbi:hypothetical protein RHMOL_Rhmol04G0362200 [Rhododendron molle]|uniref:Uncharacterized protein n=1 Tax=Rhododendron molle TaxID=49168 RepID=A0ACC0P9J5_RHOML|nr:hypothetical protein RHMOL_Rhmol04G0362200 [Rhododendron molle]
MVYRQGERCSLNFSSAGPISCVLFYALLFLRYIVVTIHVAGFQIVAIFMQTGGPEKSVDAISDTVRDSSHKIFIGGISKAMSPEMLKEIVSAFGILKAYPFGDDVTDVAIGLALATLRKICWCDRFVRSGLWKDGDFQLGSKGFAQGSSQG